MNNINEAFLSSEDDFTIFKYKDLTIRFRAPFSLEYYKEIKEWDNGYIEVTAKYKHNENLEEEYIDLIPILEDLYISPENFLKDIKKVSVLYA